MKEPVWLPRKVIFAIHEQLLERHGGGDGIRDEGLLDSALSRPQQLFHYESAALFSLAAAYAHGIVKNHPFIDGNKRTGFMAAYSFLGANGQRLTASEVEAVTQTLVLAAGSCDAADYAEWLRKNCQPRES
jgi:death-on-curing protein